MHPQLNVPIASDRSRELVERANRARLVRSHRRFRLNRHKNQGETT